MGNTLLEYKDLVNDALKSGIAETIVTESPFLRYLPFKPIAGATWKYKMETAEPTVPFHEVNGTWTRQNPTWEDRYADLAILGDDAEVDRFAVATMGSQERIAAEIVKLKSKGLANRFEACAILGRTTASVDYSSSMVFKGLGRLIAEAESSTTTDLDGVNNAQVYAAHATSTVLTIDLLDSLIAKVKPRPTHIIMNTDMRNKLASLARAAGNNLQVGSGALGLPVEMYGTYPILICDFIPINVLDGASSVLTIASHNPATTRASGYDNSLIFAVRLGDTDLTGITAQGAPMIQTEDINISGEKDADGKRIKFYCGLALANKRSAAVMINVSHATL